MTEYLSVSTFIEALWNDEKNKDVVHAFMHNKLCRDAAEGKAEALEAYKNYAIVSPRS